MPRSLQDVLRAGQERSRANAPRVIQTQMEREEEMRESARRIVHAKNWKERANEAKHAWNRNWEEARNQVDMKDGARDCFAEREDLWRQVEGMEALRETSNVYKHLYNDLLERHEGIVGRLMYSQNQEKLKERIFMGNANEARAMGNMEDAEDFEERRIRARDAIQKFNYIIYGFAGMPPEPQAGERLERERTQAEERPYQNEGAEVGKVGW